MLSYKPRAELAFLPCCLIWVVPIGDYDKDGDGDGDVDDDDNNDDVDEIMSCAKAVLWSIGLRCFCCCCW